MQKEFSIRKVTYSETVQMLRDELAQRGLANAVEDRLDEINSLTVGLGYLLHREVQEQLSEIVELIKIALDDKK